MSKGLFANWRFRSAHPAFEPGQTFEVYLTAFDGATGKGEARVGDSILEIEGAAAEHVDSLVAVEVDAFDKQTHRGTARVRG